MTLNQHQIEFVERALKRDLIPSELAYLNDNCGPDTGFLDLDPRPQEGRKNLVFYTACTGVQMRHYIMTHRPEVAAEYQISHVVAHALTMRSAVPTFAVPETIPAIIKQADALIYNPVDASYPHLSSESVVRRVPEHCKLASFAGPHHGCWWLICPFFGEEGVVAMLTDGFTPQEIFRSIENKVFNPKFKERFEQQMAWLKGYQHATDVRLTDFILEEYQKCKMFFTFNHPSCHLLAFAADECLAHFGFERKGREHAISVVQADEKMMGDVFPETEYEWAHYGFKYPMRWTDRMGGMEFYRSQVERIAREWEAKKTS